MPALTIITGCATAQEAKDRALDYKGQGFGTVLVLGPSTRFQTIFGDEAFWPTPPTESYAVIATNDPITYFAGGPAD